MSSRLRQHYLDYIAVLNDRRFDDLAGFGDLTYNGRPSTRLQYQRDRQGEAAAIPDLRFNVGLLVAEGDLVACKLDFDCTPVKTFLGFEPSGNRIQFTEHVFYRFSGELIVAVTSLLASPRSSVRYPVPARPSKPAPRPSGLPPSGGGRA